MDGRSFDDLTRALATGTSRRRLLRGALAALGGVLATGQVSPAGAACPPDQIARPRVGCVCKSTGRPPNGAGCPCPTGQARCGDACRDVAADLANCGGCGLACPPSADPCLLATCRRGACVAVPAPTGARCEDSDPCTTGDTCDGHGACLPGAVTDCADAGDQCNDGVCDPATGACLPRPKPSGTDCDDGDACTASAACDGAGRCVGVPTDCDDGLACTASACEASSGECVHLLLAGWCLIGGACVAAETRHPTNPCQRCDPALAVDAWSDAPQGTPCADDTRCNGDEACDGEGACRPGEPVTCPDPRPCQVAGGCDPATGACRYALKAADVVCRPAAHACEADARCDGVSPDCPANPAVVCDDGLSCTVDTCDPSSGCVHAYNPASLECLIDDACHPINTPHPANPCRSCQPLVNEVGWSPWPTDGVVPCEPELACTDLGRCHGGACVGTPAAGACLIGGACYAAGERHPANPCQGCDPARATDAWTNLPFGVSCADDDRCDGEEACDSAGACQPGVPVRCRSPRPCEEEGVCDPGTGTCTFAPKADGAACEDGNLCTLGDTCQAGVCMAGTHRPCDPPEVCHQLVGCDPATGECLYWQLGDGTPCGPETECHIRVCQSGECAQVRKPTGSACDDGLACTEGAACQADGACTGAVQADACLIAGVCYEDGAPNPAVPCQHCDPAQATDAWTPEPAGTACDDGLACTTATCQADGTCTGAVQADACLIDGACYAAGETQGDSLCVACVPTISQQFWIGLGGVPCGSPCLTDALCSAGVCVGDVAPDTCAIGAACYPAGAHDPANPCWLCDPTRDALDWSRPLSGTYCVIDTRCYPAGAPNPANPCQICDPTQRTNAWSHAPAGIPCETTCQSGGVCSRGICGGTIAGGVCAIDGACYAAGDRHPFFPCLACDPTVRQDLWTPLSDGTSCTNHCLANATSTCQNAVCVGETVVDCPQPPNLPLCQEVVCDPATGGCVKAGVHLREDRQGCEICTRCESGICITTPLPVNCGDPALGSCQVCDPVTGTCVRVPAGTDCGSTCDTRMTCDAAGVCSGFTIPGSGCLNIGECPATVCDPATVRCIETGANDGKVCGTDGCHECRNGQCVLRDCGDCQRCDPATETCVACEPCCDGRCDWLPCDGKCCAPGLECGRLAGLSDLACVLPCANERCGGTCCAPFQSCCSPGSANETCGYPCGSGCFQTPATCCGTFGEFVIRCGDDEICCSTSSTGCCGSHQVCRTNGCAPV